MRPRFLSSLALGRFSRFTLPVCLAFVGLAGIAPAHAATIDLGTFSFIHLGNGSVGFTISNFTGSPNTCTAPCALSQYPVVSDVTFSNLALNYTVGSGTTTANASDVVSANGSTTPSEFQFPDTTQFSAATLLGTLSQTTVLLEDGSQFAFSSPSITVTLSPGSGNTTLLDGDTAEILVEGAAAASSVPEPSSFFLLSVGLSALGGWSLRNRYRSVMTR